MAPAASVTPTPSLALDPGKTPAELVKEWDKNGDGDLSKIEFKQAVRLTLKLNATNDEIDEIFDLLDKDQDGHLIIESEGQ